LAFARFAPVARGMLIVLYYFAFLAKLNRDFFDLDVSCAATMYRTLSQTVTLLPAGDSAAGLAIAGALLVEGSLPLLFTWQRTRLFGLLLGLPFHWLLGALGHQSFSALVYGLYSLFIVGELARIVESGGRKLVARLGELGLRSCLGVYRLTVLLGIGTVIWIRSLEPSQSLPLRFIAFRLPDALWAIWSLVLMALYLLAIARLLRRGQRAAAGSLVSPGWLYVFPALVVINGLSQYLGLKTASSFTMYSNLRTEAGVNNHWFMPALRLLPHQDEWVEIVESDHPELERYRASGQRLTTFELRRLLDRHPGDVSVRFRDGSGTMTTFYRHNGRVTGAELIPPPYVAAKLLYFRPIDGGEQARCQH
jgi:hypothetical protein